MIAVHATRLHVLCVSCRHEAKDIHREATRTAVHQLN